MSSLQFKVPGPGLSTGDRIWLCAEKDGRQTPPGVVGVPGLPVLRVGDRLHDREEQYLKVLGRFRWPGFADLPARSCWLAEAMDDLHGGQTLDVQTGRTGLSLAWVTVSDKGAAGERADMAGPLVAELADLELRICHASGFVVPDELRDIRAVLTDLALFQRYDLVVTTGGTGVSPRDMTPEATLAVIEKRLPGMERAMTLDSLNKTPRAMLSRAVAGTLGEALVVNLPGSPKGVRECLPVVFPVVEHGLAKLADDPADCGSAS